MKGHFKHVWLFIGVVVISASCGFGYEAKRSRSQFKEAVDAFSKRDWDRVAANLSDPTSKYAPSQKALATFLKTYLDPELATGKYELVSQETNSTMVPVKNMVVSYQPTGIPSRPVAMLQYYDDAIWFDIPFSNRKWGIFKGKIISIPFYMMFMRICRDRYPQADRRDNWKSVLDFVGAEKSNLTEMGITPTNLYSQSKSWDDYSTEYEARIRKWLASRRT